MANLDVISVVNFGQSKIVVFANVWRLILYTPVNNFKEDNTF